MHVTYDAALMTHNLVSSGNTFLKKSTESLQIIRAKASAWQVNEAAGSYLWHDHSGSNKADGLQGALIVHAKGPEPWTYDEERTLFLTDWFHGQTCCCRPCPALPCPALPSPALPCPALPCPALPCPALPALPYPCPMS